MTAFGGVGGNGIHWYAAEADHPTWSYIYLSQARGKDANDSRAKVLLCPSAGPVRTGTALHFNHNYCYSYEVGGRDDGGNNYTRRQSGDRAVSFDRLLLFRHRDRTVYG